MLHFQLWIHHFPPLGTELQSCSCSQDWAGLPGGCARGQETKGSLEGVGQFL